MEAVQETAGRAKVESVASYLAYAIEDVRSISPIGAYLLEMAIAAIKDDRLMKRLRIPKEHLHS